MLKFAFSMTFLLRPNPVTDNSDKLSSYLITAISYRLTAKNSCNFAVFF